MTLTTPTSTPGTSATLAAAAAVGDAQSTPAEAARAAVAGVLADLDRLSGERRGVCVDAPPGAGKSTLAVAATRHLADSDRPVMIVSQTNEQADDLVDRLAQDCPGLSLARLHKSEYTPPARVLRHGTRIALGSDAQALESAQAIVATAAKWAYAKRIDPRWAIIDEVYQMRSDALLLLAGRFDRALFVGDPGQLDPFSAYETEQWAGSDWNPLDNAMDVTLRNNPDLPVHRLPVSWRLPASAIPLVSPAFYPGHGFGSGTGPGERALVLGDAAAGVGGGAAAGGGAGGAALAGAAEEAVDRAAATGWSYLELPARHTIRTDEQIATAIAHVVVGLLRRSALAVSERAPEGAAVTAERIAVGTAHRDQRQAVKRALRRLGGHVAEAVTVDTANTLQGREFDVTVCWHPLSGRVDVSRFHLETGRLCVLLSRHRHACIVVGRSGVQEILDAQPGGGGPARLGVPPKFPDGWFAHQTVLARLRRSEHLVRVR